MTDQKLIQKMGNGWQWAIYHAKVVSAGGLIDGSHTPMKRWDLDMKWVPSYQPMVAHWTIESNLPKVWYPLEQRG
ncbi:hypothetical protein PJP12_30070, partial [Mycobacterium kansasii]